MNGFWNLVIGLAQAVAGAVAVAVVAKKNTNNSKKNK